MEVHAERLPTPDLYRGEVATVAEVEVPDLLDGGGTAVELEPGGKDAIPGDQPRPGARGRSNRPKIATRPNRIAAGTASHTVRSIHHLAVLSGCVPIPSGQRRRIASR